MLIESCISEEHKNEIEQMLTDKEITFETTLIDQTSNEWFIGGFQCGTGRIFAEKPLKRYNGTTWEVTSY